MSPRQRPRSFSGMKMLSLAVSTVLCISATLATPVNQATRTSTSERAIVSQIRTVQDPVYHYYLQNHNGVPQLGPEASSDYFNIGTTILDTNSTVYLNVDRSATTSYKKLSFNSTAATTSFALEGDTIILQNPRQLNFIACSTSSTQYYDVYLQEGNDAPSGSTCTLVTLHLPCLC